MRFVLDVAHGVFSKCPEGINKKGVAFRADAFVQ